MKKDFTQEEAAAKVGKKIRTLAAWAGVPRGTTGTVVKADQMGRVKPLDKDPQKIWDVVIEWDLPVPPLRVHKPLQDWFTKDEYETYIEEV